jgi:cell division protein FtsI/penicillin-binding protein 2
MSSRRRRISWRLFVLGLLLAAGGLAVVGRLAYLQIVRHEHYIAEAEEEHTARQVLQPSRGAILDRNGYPLATTVDAFDILIDRRVWQHDASVDDWAEQLAPLVERDPQDLLASVKAEPDDEERYYLVAAAIDYETGNRIRDLTLPGVSAVNTSTRFYPEGDLASSVLGFIGRDQQGLAGLEASLQDQLAGSPGDLLYERDTFGNPIPFGSHKGDPPSPGADVRLTIDRYIQRLVEQELDARIEAHGASGGAIIVMDPRTGEILAMASRPSFRLTQLDLSSDADVSLFRNRAVTDVYEPGSVMKVVTVSAAIDLGLVSPDTTYYDSGYAEVPGAEIYNWDFSVNGIQTVTQLLQKSLNTGAVWLSGLIGADRFYDYVRGFGFGEPTGIGLGGEASGLVRTNQDSGWYPVDLATNSFGQGVAATPLQVITAVAAIANGGRLMRPYIVQEVAGPDGRHVYEPTVVRQVVSEATAATVSDLMVAVVEGVPNHLARIPGYNVAGKTGTTIVSIPGGYALDATLASFVGFAPAEDPRIIMLVRIDEPQDDPLGGVVAAPIFADLAPQILSYLNVQPNDELLAHGP